MNIRIQVMANQARQAINQVQGDLSKLSSSTAAANAATSGSSGATATATAAMARFGTTLGAVGTKIRSFPAAISAMGNAMVKSGSQMQWVGRQLTYNVTLPLALAGAAGVKFATDNDKAMRNLQKVYGDASMSTAQVTKETTALGRTFEMLSNIYGISRSEVIGIGAAWAAAGSSGLALAKQTKLTMDMMVLGEMNATDATQALIAIQAQYGFNANQLTTTIAQLNNVENQTGTTMADLVTAMSRTAGVAKSTGVDVAHLAAMTAALVPAAGTASQAGNALKTIISRLLAPTSDASDLMGAMGINMKSAAWQSADASTRLVILSKHFENLSDAQKVVVSTTLASRYQLNKFDVLMAAIANHSSYYYKALAAANDKQQAFAQYTRELNMVLDSDANKFARAKVMLQNVAADAIVPLMPLITGLAAEVAKFAQKFQDLSPATQKLIVGLALFFALLGPIYTRLGALRILVGLLMKGFALLLKPLAFVVGMLWDMAAAVVSFAWGAMVQGATALAGILAGPLVAAWDAVLAAASYAGVFILDALGGVFAGVRTAWIVGLTSLSDLFLGGFSVLAVGVMDTFAAMWATLLATVTAEGSVFMRVWTTVTTAIATIWEMALIAVERLTAIFGPSLRALWIAVTVPLEMITAEVGYALSEIWLTAQTVFETVLIEGARAAGVIWRSGLIVLEFITAEVGSALSKIWAGAQVVFEAVVIGGARALGIAYRAVMVTMEVVTAEVGAGIAGIWRALQAILATIQVAGGALLRAAWAATSAAFEALVIGTATVVGALWRSAQMAWAAIQVWGGALLRTAWAITSTAFETLVIGTAAAVGAIWRAAQIAWAAIQIAGGKLLLLAWEGIQAAMAIVTSISWSNILSVVGKGGSMLMGLVTRLGPMLLSALTNPWVLGAVAVLIAIYAMRDKLKGAWNAIVGFFQHMISNVLGAFHALPQGVQSNIMAVVNMVKAAAQAVAHWFSYLNPFAHHSPSLVEVVTSGMAAVRAQFGTLVQVEGPVSKAYASLARFKSAALDLGGALKKLQLGQDIDKLAKAGAPASAIAGYKDLFTQVNADQKQADGLSNAIRGQQAIVDNWQRTLDNANATLDTQKTALQALQDQSDKYKTAIQGMTDNISNLAQTPIKGMKAMSDAIFGNEMAQKRLQLQMDKLADAGGKDYGSIQNAVASLQGEIESLRGKESDLRAAGAGSEITGQLDKQIAGLQGQQKAFQANGTQIGKLNDQLSTLQHQADEMNLEQSLKFDPLTRQIDNMANGMKELPFDQIVGGIKKNQAGLVPLQTAYKAVNDQITAQQAKVDQAQAAVDSAQKSYDTQNSKLTALKDSYDAITQAIQDMSSAMNDATSAADSLNQAHAKKPTDAMKNFAAAAGGNFAQVGGKTGVGREGGMGDQSALIDQWTKDTQKKMGNAFTGIDMFGPFKDMWKGFVKWWNANAAPFLGGIGSMISAAFKGAGGGGMFDGIKNAFKGVDWAGMLKSAWSTISTLMGAIWDWAGQIWAYLGPSIMKVIGLFKDYFKQLLAFFGQVWHDIAIRIQPFMKAIQNLIKIAKPVVSFFIADFMVGIKTAFQAIVNIGKPILDWVIRMFKDVWEIVLGVIDIFIGLFTGDWKRMWDGIVAVLGGALRIVWDTIKLIGGIFAGIAITIWDFIKNVAGFGLKIMQGIWNGMKAGWNAFWGWVKGLWNGFIDWFKGLFGIGSPSSVFLQFGIAIIQGLWNGIKAIWTGVFGWFGNVLGWIWKALGKVDKFLYDKGKALLQGMWNGIKWIAGKVWNYFKNLPHNFWTGLGKIDKFLYDKGKELLQGMWNGITYIAGKVKDYFTALPGNEVRGWKKIGSFLYQHGKDLLTGMWNGIKHVASSLSTWFTNLPGKIASWIGKVSSTLYNIGKSILNGMGSGINAAWATIKEKAKTPVQWVVDVIWNDGLRKLWNTMNNLWGGNDIAPFKFNAKAAEGTVLPGYTPGRDVHRFWSPTGGKLSLSGGEAIMVPEFTRGVGKEGIDYLNHLARTQGAAAVKALFSDTGKDKHFAGGGIVGLPGWLNTALKFIPGMGTVSKVINSLNGSNPHSGGLFQQGFGVSFLKSLADKIWIAVKKVWGDDTKPGSAGGARPSNGHSQINRMFSTIKKVFPDARLNSSFRPGDPGYHGLGKAVDLGQMGFPGGNGRPLLASMKSWIYRNVKSIAELIYDGLGSKVPDVKNALNHMYDATTRGQHHNHVHWAMDQWGTAPGRAGGIGRMGMVDTGGLIQHGAGGINLSGNAERVLSPRQTQAFEKLVKILDDLDMVDLEARLNGSEARSAGVTYINNDNSTTININGDLSFPNITDGDDAEVFIRNLGDMAGSGGRR